MEYEEPNSRLILNNSMTSYVWQVKDTLGIFPTQGGQVEFPITEEGTKVADFDGGGWALKDTCSYSAYYPFNFYNRNVNAIPISYYGQEFDGNKINKGENVRNYLHYGSELSTVIDSKLIFHLRHQGTIMVLTLTMPEAGNYTSLTVYTTEKILPVKKTINLAASFSENRLPYSTVDLSDRLSVGLKNMSTTVENEEMTVWMVFPSVDADTNPLNVAVFDEDGRAFTGTVKKSDNTDAYASFKAHKIHLRYATLEYNPNFTLGVTSVTLEQWQNGGEYNETVTAP